jgi:two-component system sensor histidine kinase RstB
MVDYQSSMYRTISHELRTPLSRIKFSLALIDKDSISSQNSDYIKGVEDNLCALEKLIDQILYFSKIENTKAGLKLESLSLEWLFEEMQESFDAKLYEKSISIDLASGLRRENLSQLLVSADRNLFFIAISNIIQNALVYSESQVRVCLDHRKGYNNEYMALIIEDDGPGLSDNQLSKLYQPFSETKLKPDGSKSFGFGLAISKQLIDLHGGEIVYKNNKLNSQSSLQGAYFEIKLPLLNT